MSRHIVRTGTVVMLAVGLLLAVAPGHAQSSASSREAAARVKKSVAQNDLAEMASAMGAMIPSTDGSGERLAKRIVERGTPAQRMVAASVLGERARLEDLASLIDALDRSKYPDERRWLVGAIGTRAREIAQARGDDRGAELRAAAGLLLPLVQDADFQIRAAAMRALADTRTPAALLDAKFSLPRAPGISAPWSDYTEQGILTWAVYGCATALLGVRGESEGEVVACMRDRAAEIRALPPGEVLARPDEGTGSAHFVVIERLGNLPDRELDRMADAVVASCRSCFPGACLPPLRLIMTDGRGMAKVGSPPQGFLGMWGGNTLGVVLGERDQMLAMLGHEYALTIHSSQFIRQPVWLMEGMASSLTASAQRPAYAPGMAPPPDVAPLIEAGAFQTLARWTGEAIPNQNEHARFTLSHVAVDYLRYRGFAEHEARLNALMGMLSRGASTQQALETIFDSPIERLDEDLRAWLRGDVR